MLRRLVVLGVVPLVALAMGSGARAHPTITTALSWEREVAPIVTARCVTCHRDGGRAPMSLSTYEAARPWARAIRHQVVTRQMPKWHAARGYGEFANDPSLTPYEIAMIAAWVEGGAPRTIPAKPREALSKPLTPPLPFTPPAGRIEWTVPCGDELIPPGQVLGLKPLVSAGGSVRVVAALPDGRRENLGWFRDVDPDFNPIYWLRDSLIVPSGTRLLSTGTGGDCRLNLVLGKQTVKQ